MVTKICITFPDATMDAVGMYEEKYHIGNTPEAIRQIVNRYLVLEEGQ